MADVKELRAVPRIDCFSRARFDENVECGLVIDISNTGAGLTIAKDTDFFKDVDPQQAADSHACLRLNIFHPDYPSENSLNIDANIAWLDQEYSKDRLKLGVSFSELDESESRYVSSFIDWIQEEENYFLRCELEKC